MIIAQITDIHLGFEPDNPGELNRRRLTQVVNAIQRGATKPDLLIATGDLTDRGDIVSYQRLRDAFSVLDIPVWPCLGNHDLRDNFHQVFPDVPVADGFIQYALNIAGLRVIMLDTLEEGRHGGAFCDRRAAWLTERLAEAPDVPTVIVMHHPPVVVGIDWMDPGVDEPWIARFRAVVEGQVQVQAILCGHLHRPISTRFGQTSLSICPASAPELVLDLRPMDLDEPDGRDMVNLEAPGFALHRWDGRHFITHFATADDAIVVARHDEKMHPLVQAMLAERR
jgi:Icc protein